MFGEKHYVPVLKGKAGEFQALSELDNASYQEITPLIEIPDRPFNFEVEDYSKSVEEHLNSTLQNIIDSWESDYYFFIDNLELEGDEQFGAGVEPIIWITTELLNAGFNPIPIITINDELSLRQEFLRIKPSLPYGMCLRLKPEDWSRPNIKAQIDGLLNDLQIVPADLNLIIDLEYIHPNQSHTALITTQTLINTIIPYITDWRSLTLAGSSFPIDLSGLERNNINNVSRFEWLNWNNLYLNRAGLRRMPSFGDYAISNPDVPDLDPRFIAPSANIRYTVSDRWLVFKGISLRNSRVRFSQFHTIANDVRNHAQYSGRTFSFGDNYIYECADRTTNPGSLKTWRAVGTNHHIEFVINQIANLP